MSTVQCISVQDSGVPGPPPGGGEAVNTGVSTQRPVLGEFRGYPGPASSCRSPPGDRWCCPPRCRACPGPGSDPRTPTYPPPGPAPHTARHTPGLLTTEQCSKPQFPPVCPPGRSRGRAPPGPGSRQGGTGTDFEQELTCFSQSIMYNTVEVALCLQMIC